MDLDGHIGVNVLVVMLKKSLVRQSYNYNLIRDSQTYGESKFFKKNDLHLKVER